MPDLYFQTLKVQSPVSARLIPGQGVTHLVFAGEDHKPWHSYSAPTEEMPGILAELLAQAQAIAAGENPLSEDWHVNLSALAREELGVATWKRKTAYSPGDGQRPRSAITLADLKKVDDETALALLIERFRHSDAKIYNALLTDYYTLTKRHYKGTSDADLDLDDVAAASLPQEDAPALVQRAPSQLQRDLETIRPHLSTLIQNGQLVRGIQTRIAEILGITNAGATHRQRILKIVRVLETHLKKNSSTTSSTAAEEAADLDPGAIRAA